MVQRIQSVYFSISLVLMTLVLLFPLARFIGEDGQIYLLKVWGIVSEGSAATGSVVKSIPMLILFMVILFFLLITLFSFKNRIRQIRFSIFTMLLMVGSLVLIYFYRYQGIKTLQAEAYFTLYSAFPVISAILTYLGFRGVKKDEELIRSYDRIR